MICYKDRTYCGFYMLCKNGYKCDRALTTEVIKDAKKGNLLICQYTEFPDCFIRLWETDKCEN